MYVKELGLDVKSTNLQFKDIDMKQGIVQGYFSAFNVKDWDGDILLKGAFAKTIKERGPHSPKPQIKHLLDHNFANAVAKIQELEEDDFGLLYTSKAGRHTNGQDWLKMCEDGIITEHSTGTITERSKVQKKAEGNYVTETKMFEGSSLQFLGANSSTPIVRIKSYKMLELKDRLSILEKAMREGTYTDETFTQVIEPEFKHISRIIENLSVETTQPGPEQHTIEPNTEKNLDLIESLKSINQLFN